MDYKKYKFKAWDNEKKRYILNFRISPNGEIWELVEGDYYLNENAEAILFTGKEDNNKKEVYDGDIIQRKEEKENTILTRKDEDCHAPDYDDCTDDCFFEKPTIWISVIKYNPDRGSFWVWEQCVNDVFEWREYEDVWSEDFLDLDYTLESNVVIGNIFENPELCVG